MDVGVAGTLKKNDYALSIFRCVILALMPIAVLLYFYAPGVNGPFLLDDFFTLRMLGVIQGELNPENILAYLETGITGPTGRPLALLSFLFDGTQWPTSAEPFKRTNIFLHGCNGLLVFWIARAGLEMVREKSTITTLIAALLAMAWMFSPYHASTVLYIVQRMAILSATCVLLGLILFFKGRLFLTTRPRMGWLLIILSYVIGAGLGVMAKENAALYVLFVPLVEWVWFRRDALSITSRKRLYLLVGLPVAFFMLAMAVQIPSFLVEYGTYRDFSLYERALTQLRAVGYYLWRYVVPGKDYIGIYADGILKSEGLLTPASTLAWLVVHVALISLAFAWKKKHPLLCFGVLFFYIGHLMESTIVPLELIFEHRNYLPSAFVLLALASVRSLHTVVVLLFFAVVLNLAFLPAQAALLGDKHALAASSTDTKFASERSTMALAQSHLDARENGKALEILRAYGASHELPPHIAFMRTITACLANDVQASDIDSLLSSPFVSRAKRGMFARRSGDLITLVKNGVCDDLSFQHVRKLLANYLIAFPRSPGEMQTYYVASAKLRLAEGDREGFILEGYRAVKANPNVEFTVDFCRAVGREAGGSNEECACLQLGHEVLDRDSGIETTLVRILSGYEERVLDLYREHSKNVCADDDNAVGVRRYERDRTSTKET